MVIVSRKCKFIFIKPYLVNARHIENQLQKYCDNNDIIASMQSYLTHTGKNIGILKMSHSIFPWYCHVHLPINILFPKINKFYKRNISDEYLKISVIKNPYELLIDFFWFYTDHVGKYYNKDGSINKKNILNPKKTSIGFYIEKHNGVIKGEKWEIIRNMFNNWITSGILLDEQTSKWEYLNELFYYEDKIKKETKIDFFININNNPQKSINELCEKLNITPFTIKKSKKKNPEIWNKKKFCHYFSKESLEFIEKHFYYTLKQGNYTYEPHCIYSQL